MQYTVFACFNKFSVSLRASLYFLISLELMMIFLFLRISSVGSWGEKPKNETYGSTGGVVELCGKHT